MSLDSQSFALEKFPHKNGLVYDADSVTLIGCYGDELSAYRARRCWIEVFSNYFLLERERDYEVSVTVSEDEQIFSLSATFVSACGRYAFWRLINRQAPEAEQKLYGNAGSSKSLLSSLIGADEPWIIESGEQAIEEDTSWYIRLREFFRS